MTLKEEFATRNFSIYGQWLGILSMIICFAVGISAILTFRPLLMIFGGFCLASFVLILFVEIPICLRIFRLADCLEGWIRWVSSSFKRAAFYLVLGIVQWLSILGGGSSLIAAALFLTLTAICYALAAIKKQEFVGSKTLGGSGMGHMIP